MELSLIGDMYVCMYVCMYSDQLFCLYWLGHSGVLTQVAFNRWDSARDVVHVKRCDDWTGRRLHCGWSNRAVAFIWLADALRCFFHRACQIWSHTVDERIQTSTSLIILSILLVLLLPLSSPLRDFANLSIINITCQSHLHANATRHAPNLE